MVPIEQQAVLDQIDRIIKIYVTSEGHVRPHFFMTGPSGSGKTHLAEYAAQANDLNFVEINAAQLTREGTSGNSLSKALTPLLTTSGRPTIVFVDEFDKLFISGNNNSEISHESTTAVQNEFLKVLESKTTSVFGDYGKYINVQVDKCLFIFAGAFNGEEDITVDRLRELGIKTEFLGRVGLLFNLVKLSLNSMYEILKDHKLLNSYLKLFPDANREECIAAIMNHLQRVYDQNTLGTRMLTTLLHQYFINGGKLEEVQVNQSAFTKTLSFNLQGQLGHAE